MAVGGAGVALDAQTLAVFAMMSCSRPGERRVTKNARMLAPLATGNTWAAMIAGNFILLGVVFCLQSIVILVRVNVMKDMSLGMARGFARFPGFLYSVTVLAHQGTAAAALKLLVAPDAETENAGHMVLGILALTFNIATPIVVTLVVYFHVTAKFEAYDYQIWDEYPKLTKTPLRFLLPVGRWEPRKVRRQFGALFASHQRNELVWCSAALWDPTIMVIGSAFRPETTTGCASQFAVMAVCQFLIALVVMILRPYRSLPANLLQCLSSVTLGVLLSGTAAGATNPSASTQSTILVALQLHLAVTCLRILYAGVTWLVEHNFLSKKAPRKFVRERIGRNAKSDVTAPGDENPMAGGEMDVPLLTVNTLDQGGDGDEKGATLDAVDSGSLTPPASSLPLHSEPQIINAQPPGGELALDELTTDDGNTSSSDDSMPRPEESGVGIVQRIDFSNIAGNLVSAMNPDELEDLMANAEQEAERGEAVELEELGGKYKSLLIADDEDAAPVSYFDDLKQRKAREKWNNQQQNNITSTSTSLDSRSPPPAAAAERTRDPTNAPDSLVLGIDDDMMECL